MIKHIDDLLIYQNKLADFLGGLNENPRLNLLADCYKLDEKEIGKKINLPESYLFVIRKYNCMNKVIGYFSISPINYDVDNIVDSLIMAQDPEHSFLPRSILDPFDLYWIGNNNNDTIYVAGKNSPKYQEGEIVDIHEFILDAQEKDYDDYMMPMAKDFEQFLILAGNLNQVHREFKDETEAKNEMKRRLNLLNVDQKYHDAWYAYL
ncbi:MAG: hypothetical protein FADNKDHG_01598 [Holosporales bacterium]